MKVTITIQPDIQIPNHLYNEAAELFLNHIQKHYEELLLKGDNSPLTLKEKEQMNSTHIHVYRPLVAYGQRCPLYYRKRKGIYSDQQVRQSQALHTPR